MTISETMQLAERYFGTYKNKSDEYRMERSRLAVDNKEIETGRQFFYLYQARLNAMTPAILERAKRTIGPHVEKTSLVGLKLGQEAFVVGVILKKMKYRQSVLYEFLDDDTRETEMRDKINSDNLAADSDLLEFEDSQQKMRLIGSIDKDQFVSGNVIGIYGMLERDDYLHVKQIVLPEMAPQVAWPELNQKDCYVLFLSGISLRPGFHDCATRNALMRLCDWVSNEHGDEEGIVENICRVVIAGESVRVTDEDISKQKIGFLGLEDDTSDEAIYWLDRFLSQMLGAAPVDLMSGPNDPCSLLLPQRPMPRVLFPDASNFGACFATVTNPYKFELDGITFLGTSGQNILDMKRLTSGLSQMDLMKQCLERGHLVPTAPDTLDAWSFEDRDPFVLKDLPHILFAGNQQRLDISWMEGGEKEGEGQSKTLMLTIPAFAASKKAVLLNLKNMRVREMDFADD